MAESFSVALKNELGMVRESLPVGFNEDRFVHNALHLINGNKVLTDFAQKYGTTQIKSGLLRGAYLGLDAMHKEFYLIPYGNTLNFMLSYIGCEKLAKKYSIRPVLDIYAKVVREGDAFEEKIIDGRETIDFRPLPFNDAKIIGAFALCIFKDGGMLVDTMSMAQIKVTRSKSKSPNGVWKDFEEEMCKKTVIHRLAKHIELDLDTMQREIWDDDMAIETDSKKILNSEMEENANSTIFDIE